MEFQSPLKKDGIYDGMKVNLFFLYQYYFIGDILG